MAHKLQLLALTFVAEILLLVNVVLFATFSILGLNRGLVFNTFGEVTTLTQLVTYITWSVVYVYQILSVSCALVLVGRHRAGDPLLVSPLTLGLYILAQVFQLVVNSVFRLEVTFTFLTATAFTLLAVLAFSYISLYKNRFVIARRNLRLDDSLVRGLFQNSVDLYLTWAAFSAILNFAVLLINRTNPPLYPSIAFALSLTVIMVLNFFYVITDLTLFDMVSRYTLAPYFFRLWVIGLLLPETKSVGLIIIETLIILFTVASLAGKFAIIAMRRKSRPLIPDT